MKARDPINHSIYSCKKCGLVSDKIEVHYDMRYVCNTCRINEKRDGSVMNSVLEKEGEQDASTNR